MATRIALWCALLVVTFVLNFQGEIARAQQDETSGAGTQTPSAEATGDVAPPAGVEMMKVKGRAVSGIEADVPESVTQFDAATIDALGAASIQDLAKVTPNVEIRSAGATTATFFIRGVGLSDFSSNAAGAVGIFQDDVQLNAPAIQNLPLFDIETVDVKRGPQGDGLFRNSSAGAIRIYSNKPTGEYEARLKQTFGSFVTDDARDAFMRDTEGMINLPLVEDVMAARIAFRIQATDPFIENGCAGAIELADRIANDSTNRRDPGVSMCGETPEVGHVSDVPPGLDKWVGDRGVWAARGSIRLSPPDAGVEFLFSVHGSRLNQDSTLGEFIGTNVVDRDPREEVREPIAFFGDEAQRSFYRPPEQLEEYAEIIESINPFSFELIDGDRAAEVLPGMTSGPDGESAAFKRDVKDTAFTILGKNLAEDRVLDREPYRGDYNKPGRTTRDTYGGFLRSEFTLGGEVDTKLTFGTEHYRRFRDSDNDFSPARVFEAVIEDSARQFTFDAEFSGDAFDGAVRWTVGNAMLYERLENLAFTDAGFSQVPVRRRFLQDTSGFVTSAEMAWDFLEDFTLEIGGRWNYETKEFRIQERRSLAVADPPDDRQRQKTWQEPTGGISLTYHINDETTLFSKYTRGFKVGHFNGNNGDEIFDPGPARPETIDAFEWGFSSSILDRRVLMRGGFFFYKYQDYQVFIFRDDPNTTPALVIRNAEEVQQFGAEFDITVEPLRDWVPDEYDNLKFIARFGWLDSEFLEFTNVIFRRDSQTGADFPVSIDFRGNPLINSPEFKVSGTIEWPLDLSEWGVLTPRYDFDWSDDIFFDPTRGRGSLDVSGVEVQPEFAIGQPARILHNISLAYRTPVGNVEVRAWVRNLLDERYKTFAFDATFFAGQVLNFVGDPRSMGMDLTVTW